MTISYATLEQLRTEGATLDGDGGTEPADTTTYYAKLTQYGISASRIIDRLMNETFAPLIASRVTDAFGDETLSGQLMMLSSSLLSVTSVTLPDSTSLTVDTDVRAEPVSTYPKRWLQMMTSTYSFRTASGTLVDDITVVGVWGWNSDYGNAWVLSGDTVKDDGGIDATETTITVTDVDGAGGLGFTPRFSAGNLIQIESEWCSVVSTIAGTTNTIEVVRGVRGSTAATHAKETPISVYYADDAIARATAKLAVFMYASRGTQGQVSFENIRTNPNNVQALAEVLILLESYRPITIAGA